MNAQQLPARSADLPSRIVVAHEYDRAAPQLRIKLTKAATKDGNYGWELSYEGDQDDADAVLARIKVLDAELRTATAPAPDKGA